MAITLAELAEHVGAKLSGGHDTTITGVATLQSARSGDISFLANSQYRKYLADTKATAVLLSEQDSEHCPVHALVCRNPYLAYAQTAALLYPEVSGSSGCHDTAVIADDSVVDKTASIGAHCVIESGVTIGANVTIGAGCVIGRDVTISANSQLKPNVTIYHGAKLGQRCIMHSGVVIGADGFGIAPAEGAWIKVPQIGSVVIGDDVEIGANTTIDRGALENTVIGNGVKLDNQIQIAHNVRIGDHTVIAACAGISGSVTIGRHCMIAGGVGVAGHLEIADGVTVTGMSMVTKSIREAGVYSSGWGAQSQASWHRQVAALRRLPKFMQKFRLDKS